MKKHLFLLLFIGFTALAIPFSSEAASSHLVWSNSENDEGEQIIEDEGIYALPFGLEREARIESSLASFGAKGFLYFINPDTLSRELVAHISGVDGADRLTWQQSGAYELDVYDDTSVFPARAPYWKKFLVWFAPAIVHAQEEEFFLETISFNISEEIEVSECCSSVLFLPGIKGSVLKSVLETLWPPTIFSNDVAQLALDPDGESINDLYVDGILNDFLGTDIYSPLSGFMNGVVTDGLINEWLPLAYDWRFSPEKILEDGIKTEDGVVNIIEKIETLASESQTGQITIIGHSMGGLMGKAIIKKLEGLGKSNLVDSFVMVGTPQLGTPQAVAAILHGDDEGIASGFIVGPMTMRVVAQNMPSAYNLLPSPSYFSEVLDPVITFNPTASFTQPWRDFWGTEINTYPNFLSFVTGTGVIREEPEEDELRDPEILHADLMVDAVSFHNEFDSYFLPDHIRVVQVAGWGRSTTKAVEYSNNHLQPSYRTIFTVEGDSTVVYPSAISSIVDETYFFDLGKYRKASSVNVQHRNILSVDPIQEILKNIIEESPISVINYISQTKPLPTEADDQLIVSTHSPVVLGVRDQLNNFTGINPNQDLSAEILFVTEDIPGSTFFYSTDRQYIFLPKEGEYHFIYKGIGEGPTTIEIQDFIADIATPIVNYSDIPTTQSTSATFTVDSQNPENTIIKVDTDNDGKMDELIVSDDIDINKLLDLLKEKIKELNIKEKLKATIIKKLENLKKKIENRQKKNKPLDGLKNKIEGIFKKIVKKGEKGVINEADIQEIIKLLEQVENAL